ncbi:hypothetical protein GOODEAATRI_004408, partial [Goodea atripinnis]
MAAELASLVQRLEVAVGRLEAVSGPGSSTGGSAGGAVAAFVEAYDEIINGPMAQYVNLSQKIGGDVQKHVGDLPSAFYEAISKSWVHPGRGGNKITGSDGSQ